jgi:hypothetical protein
VGLDARVLVVVNDFRDATGLGLNFGTDMAQIFNLIGSSYKLVTRRAHCANPLGL